MNTSMATAALAVGTLSAMAAWADQLPTKEGLAGVTKAQFSPYAGRNFPTQVFWGEGFLG